MTLKRAWRMDTPTLPVGTRCFFENKVLKLSGWGEIVEPADDIYRDSMPILMSWRGVLVGPADPGQLGLDQLAPGCGTLPGEGVHVVPAILLWVEE